MCSNTMWFPRKFVVIFVVVCQGIQIVIANTTNKTLQVYVVHYRQGKSTVPVTIEIDYEQKTEYVFNLTPKSSGKSITFYDFKQGAVAYKSLSSDQCFVSHFSGETLEAGSRILKKLNNKVNNDSLIVTLWASNRALSPKVLRRIAGGRIAELCKSSASFLVTSTEEDEPFKLRKKRDVDKQKNGPFTHRSYGHYGHQSHNYAHYGHETYTGGQLSSAGESLQKAEQYQSRRFVPQQAIPTDVSRRFPPPASSGYIDKSSDAGGSEGFALQTRYQGGYQINQPLGLRAGSHYSGALDTQGQYVSSSGRLPAGVSTTHSQAPGLALRSDIPAGIPGTLVGPRTVTTSPRLSGHPLKTQVDQTPDNRKTTELRKDPRSGFPSPGYPFSVMGQPGLPSYPSTTGLEPSRSPHTSQSGYYVPRQTPCCQQKTGDVAHVSPATSRIPLPSGIVQTGHVPSATAKTLPGYPATGISQELRPSHYIPPVVTRPGYEHSGMLPSVYAPFEGFPSAFPSSETPQSTHIQPQTSQPRRLPPEGARTEGQLPTCCMSKVQQPGIATPDVSIPPTRDIPKRLDYPSLPASALDYPSSVTAQTGHPDPGTIQSSHTLPGMPPCCQSKVPTPGTVTRDRDDPLGRGIQFQSGYAEIPGSRFVRPSTEIMQPQHPYPSASQPDHQPSGTPPVAYIPTAQHPDYVTLGALQPSYQLYVSPEQPHPAPPAVQQVRTFPSATAGFPPCCQPKVQGPESAPSVSPSDQTGYPLLQVKRPSYPHPGSQYSTLQPLPPSMFQPAYPPSFAQQPGLPLQTIDMDTKRTSYPSRADIQQPDRRLVGSSYPSYPSPGIPHVDYPSRDVHVGAQYPGYPSLVESKTDLPLGPVTGITPPHLSQSIQPRHPSVRTMHAVQPGYITQPGEIAPGYKPSETPGAHPTQLLPRAIPSRSVLPGYLHGTYTPDESGSPLAQPDSAQTILRPSTQRQQLPSGIYPSGTLPPVRTVLPGSTASPIGGGVALTGPGQSVRYPDDLIPLHSRDDTASSQTQVQTGYEGTAAEATSTGRHGGLGAQTQVQGGYTGNGSFSAQAQSGFTGGVTQSQVRGGRQGGSSGSSAQVERVGSAQSQVRVGRPSGAATATAQGRFLGGVTQVQAQSGKRGGSAGAQAQSMGTSSSQVQVNVEGGELQPENGFQGGVSASVSGGYYGGQAHTQLQGGYDSGRTYVATAQGGFDSASEFRGLVPGVGSIPGMLVRPLNGMLQPPSGAADVRDMKPLVTGEFSVPRDSLSRLPEESRHLHVPVPAHSGNGMTGTPRVPEVVSGQGIRYPGFEESVRRGSTFPAIPSASHLPPGPPHPAQKNGMHEGGVVRADHPGFMPSAPQVQSQFMPPVPSHAGLRPGIEIRETPGIVPLPERAPSSIRPQHSITIPGPSEFLGSMPGSVQFTRKPETSEGLIPARADGFQPLPEEFHPDRITHTQHLLPSHPSAQFPNNQQRASPPQETVLPYPHFRTPTQPVDGSFSVESRNFSRDTTPHLSSTPSRTSLPSSSTDVVPECCKSKRDWSARCCQIRKVQSSGANPRCCSSKYPQDYANFDSDPDFDDGNDGEKKDSCRIVKAVCYIVYKPSGRARICKPSASRGC